MFLHNKNSIIILGLFRAAILQSGSALSYWAIDPDPKSYAILLADTLAGGSFNKNDTQLVKTFLINQTTEALINASIILLFERQQQVWPTLEVEHEDAFITESPYELIRTGRFNKVPIITGICSEESLMFLKDLDYATRLASWYESEHSRLIPSNLYANTSDENAVVSAVRSIYLKDEENFTENMAAFANLFSDTGFTRSVIKFAELSSSFVPVYLYQFAYYGRVLWPAFIDDAERVAHAAELPFIWNMAGVSDTTNSDDILTQNRMIKLWTNFAKFLNPTPEETKLFSNLTWPTITPSNQRFLNINHTVEIRTNLRNESYSKWNDIYESYGKKPLITY